MNALTSAQFATLAAMLDVEEARAADDSYWSIRTSVLLELFP